MVKKTKILILLFSMFAAIPLQARAAIVRETSFTTAQGFTQDIVQCVGGNVEASSGRCIGTSFWNDTKIGVVGDGITSGLGDTTVHHRTGEEINLAANYSGGLGGRGQRHWIGQSHAMVNNTGSLYIDLGGTYQELWIRFYTRWQAGLKLGGDTQPIARNQKLIYFAGGACGQPWGCYFDVAGNSWRWVVGGSYPSGGINGTGWDGMFGGTQNAASDGRWVRLELHVKNSTAGQANGLVELWVDGTLQLQKTNYDMKGSTGFSGFAFPSNAQFSTTCGDSCDMYQDFDDLVVGTTGPIGPVGSTNPPPSGGTPVPGDINLDHIVNAIDYSILNSDWFTNASRSDLNTDGIVNSLDYSILNSNWFKTW
jgi:hypothetical protein